MKASLMNNPGEKSGKGEQVPTLNEELIASEERYRRLFESAKDGILILDAVTGMIIDVNPFLINLIGFSKDKLIRKEIWEIGFFRDIAANKDKFFELQQQEYVRYENLPLETVDGRKISVEFVSNVYLESNRKIIQCNIRDITERRRTINALLESEIKYRAFFENSMDAILLTSPDGNILSANQAACIMFGYPEDELIKLGRSGVTYSADQRLPALLEERKLKGKARGELTFIRKDGTHFPAEISSAIFKSHDGFERTSMIIRDITLRKLAEEEITMLSHSLKSINQCVSITDMDDKILFVNESFLKTYGYEIDELIGRRINIVNSPNNDQNQIEEILLATIKGEWQGELLNRRKNGEEFPVYLSTSVIKDKDANVLGLIGVATDITERKRAEKELILAKDNAEESDLLKSAFLANMGHEIRTPMNGILGFTELLKEPMLTGEEQQEYIKIIEKSGARMLNIINDLVSISKVESGQMELFISETNLNEQIEFIFDFFKPEAENKKLLFSFKNTLSGKEAMIHTDREKVTAILTNLVNNAIKFTSEGSVEFGCEKRGNWLEFFVKDTGIGVHQEQKVLIFERFRQGSESLTRNYEGAGLGLSISKAYVELLGGKIWVESDPDHKISAGLTEKKGSTFYFTIPYKPEKEVNITGLADTIGSVTEKKSKNLKILIVEDDRVSNLLLSIAFKKISQNILKAGNGLEAVNACRNNPDLDLVMMDIKMPEMDGYEATRQIRNFNKHVIIVAQTAYGLSGDRERAIEAGCNDYISKPLNQTNLNTVIEKYFN